MSDDDKKRDRALQRRVRERQAKTGESYQAAWRQLTGSDAPTDDDPPPEDEDIVDAETTAALLDAWQKLKLNDNAAPAPEVSFKGLGTMPANWTFSSVLYQRQVRLVERRFAAPRLVLPLHLPLVLPRQPTRATVRAKEGGIDIDRIFLSSAGTEGGAGDWVVNDIEVDGRSQLTLKNLSGALFGTHGIAANTKATTIFAIEGFDTVEHESELAIIVTYIGPNPEGVPFFAAGVGSSPPQRPTIVPVLSGSPLPASTKTTIGTRFATAPFQVDRFEIEEGVNWIVNAIRINGREQFVQPADIPGDMFATNAIDSFVSLEECEAGGEVEVDVTYIGTLERAIFNGRLEGTVIRDDYSTPPPDLRVVVRTGDTRADEVVATCNWRPRPIRAS